MDIISKLWNSIKSETLIENGLSRKEGPGHAREVSTLASCHCGRQTANYYAAGMLAGGLSVKEGLELLNSISLLQDTDRQSRTFGCFRWYGEESGVGDTNAAFFIMMPLTLVRLFRPESLPDSHCVLINDMAGKAVSWFSCQCNGTMEYCNKVISDGAALAALSFLAEDETGIRAALDFFARWDEYTTTRGWGWGENISPVYTEIILDGLMAAAEVFERLKNPMSDRLRGHIRTIVDYYRFSEGKEFIPAIRSYNFDGMIQNESVMNYKTGLLSLEKVAEQIWDNTEKKEFLITAACCYPDAIRLEGNFPEEKVRNEHIIDDAFAYTWKGNNVRLGTINHYPVLAGCYQYPTWGLGWQSMPVSFLVNGEQSAYLRFRVNDGSELRTHPSRSYEESYLNPALFKEQYLPKVRTNCAQEENRAIVIRTLEQIDNEAQEIGDEWVIHRFTGEAERYQDYILLHYPNCTAAILSLGGIGCGGEALKAGEVQPVMEGDTLYLRRALYSGPLRKIREKRLECGWVIMMFDGAADRETIYGLLADYAVQDGYTALPEAPETDARRIRTVTVKKKDTQCLTLCFDLEQRLERV